MPTPVVYEIGPEDRITAVNGEFARFAIANDAPEIADPRGRDVFDFITGARPRGLWVAVFDRVRRTGSPSVLSGRCDGPAVQRTIRMAVEPLADDGLRVSSTVLDARLRRPLVALARIDGRAGDPVTVCAWCARVGDGDGEQPGGWIAADAAAGPGGVLATDPPPLLAHTICPDCEQRMLAAAPTAA